MGGHRVVVSVPQRQCGHVSQRKVRADDVPGCEGGMMIVLAVNRVRVMIALSLIRRLRWRGGDDMSVDDESKYCGGDVEVRWRGGVPKGE